MTASVGIAKPPAFSPDRVWEAVEHIPAAKSQQPAWIRPEKGRPFTLHHPALVALLNRAPRESTKEAGFAKPIITLPMPDGSFARFEFVESPVMEPELAAKFPQIKTFLGVGIDDPTASVRFDWTPQGFHAQILSPRGAVYIDPYSRGDTGLYTSYYKRDYRRQADGFVCLTPSSGTTAPLSVAPQELLRSGPTLRTYRLACAATVEYVNFHGGTVPLGLAAVVTAVNRVTGVYETELAIRLVLVANNDQLIYTGNANQDPYTNSNGSTMLGQNQSNIDSVIGTANYDIGHVFSTGGGGVASLGVVCVSGAKARGVTGNGSPVGDSFWIDFVAHEMGHQFDANHPFNGVSGNCAGNNREPTTAYEPGSGSTIMAYAGICGADDLQPHSDPYFHSISFDEIIAYIASVSCASNSATGNTAPTVNAGANFTIPKSTPFTLTATGSDPNGDALTYCWEERDLGPAQALTDADNGSSPLFRSFNPTNITSRTFPKLSAILSNTSSLGEKLPALARTMNFRVTGRDNRPAGGGVNTSDMQVTVNSIAGPFVVTFPNTAVTIAGAQTVTWNVAGTAGAPVNAANVNILLSTDGGNTFPTTLMSNTPNDGSQQIVLPNIFNSTARIKVEGAGNIFFDVSDANFTINFSTPMPLVVGDGATVTAESCCPPNNGIDPNEQVMVDFALKNIGTGDTTNLIATLLASGGVTSPSGPQDYGTVTAGGSSVSRSFTFTATGSCAGTVTAVLQLQDGLTNMGLVTNVFNLGGLSSAITNTYSTGGIATPIPDVSTVEVPISITDTGVVTDVNVRVRLNHTFDDDLVIDLVHPDNTVVNLASNRGGAGANYGSGATSCSGTFTVFDDAAATAISAGTAPFAGTFRPEQVLSALNGKPTQGTWKLRVTDTAGADTGTVYCCQLQIGQQPLVCCTGPPNFPPALTSATVVPSAAAFSDESIAVTNVVALDFEFDPITLAYQWQFTTNFTFSDQSGATNAVLPAAPANSGKLWRCRITPSDPSCTGTNFFTATVAVNNRPNMLGRHGQPYSYDSDLFLAASPVTFPRSAIINEFSQGTSTTKEWVEMLFLNNTDARAWTLADASTSTITFSNAGLWSNVTAGTLLVVYNGTDKDTTLPADDTDPADGRLVIPHSNTTFFAGNWIGLANSPGDSIALRNSATTLVDGISYGSNSSQIPQLAGVGSGTSASYTNNTEAGAESSNNWQIVSASLATPAAGNGTVNSNFVASLRSGGQSPLFRFAAGSDLVAGLSIDATTGLLSGTINAPTGGFFNVVIERFAGTNVVSQQYNLLVGDSNSVFTIPAMKTWAMNTNYTIGGTLVVNGTLDTRGYTLVVSNTLNVASGTVSNATGLIRYHKLVGGPLPGASEQFNSLPAISAASISPASPNTTQDLMANVTSVSDADSDPLTFGYQWQDSSNNVSFANIAFTTGTLSNAATVAGKYYRVMITPNDGIGNGAPFTTGSVLVPVDSDSDGLNDDWEVANFGNLSQEANGDGDGDGFTNLQEFMAGTNPQDATDLPHITAIENVGDDTFISFTTSTNKVYRVERNDDFLVGNWTTVTNNVAGTGGIVQVSDPGAATQPQLFYRVLLLP